MTREDREDAIDIIQSILNKYEEDECLVTEITIGDEDIKAFKMAIKALEQKPILDKIRAEIEKAVWEDVIVSLDGMDEVRIPRLEPSDVFKIIDKYRAESEK